MIQRLKIFFEYLFLWILFLGSTLLFFQLFVRLTHADRRVYGTYFDPGHKPIKKVLFTPDDDVKSLLLELINNEQQRIWIAAYAFTDGDVAKALLGARKRGIDIVIVADRECNAGKYSKIPLLAHAGIPVYLYPAKNASKKYSIMHNKFMIFQKAYGTHRLLWTGSFNFTRAAATSNQENIVILEDDPTIDAYLRQYEILKKRSERSFKERSLASSLFSFC